MKAPTPDQIDAVIARLGKPGANAYFFDRLQNPLWIEPLAKRGFFKRPPEPLRNERQGTISFPDWPELRYLLRMAPEAPAIVGEVATEIPDTENARIQQTLIEIGSVLDLKSSKKLGIRALTWIDDYFLRSHFGEPVPKLISHLARQGEATLAIELSRRMFSVDEDDTGRAGSGAEAWHLERYLAACLPTLRECAAVATLELLRDLLLNAAKPASAETGEDYSYIWRGNILEANFHAKSGRDVLIDALRDSALYLAKEPSVGFARVSALLLTPERPLLTRIALYIASQVARADDPLVMELLNNLSLVDRPTCHEEYAMLLRAVFPRLPEEDRTHLVERLVSDPLQSIPESTRAQTDSSRLERIARQVLRDRLLAFGKALPKSLSATLANLVEAVGDPPERQPVVTAFGSGSPLSSQQIQSLTVAQIADYAKTWVSSNEFGAPQPEGLARNINDAVKERLKEFVDQADIWIGHDPTYVRWVIMAIGDALRNKALIEDWNPLFRLLNWAVVQKDAGQATAEDPWAERDTTWRFTRQSVVRLIDSALQHKGSQPDFKYRSELWSILDPLLHDPDPALQDARSGADDDLLSVSINSTRGMAVQVLMRYVWWVHESTEREQPFSFDEIPEAQAALEAALDDEHPAILSAFGQWFRQLYFLDSQWTRKHIDAIFPEADDRELFWTASWQTFVEFSPPYDPAFELLRPKYALGVARLSSEIKQTNRRSGERGSGEHLGSYFWRGVGGDFTTGLLKRFFEGSSAEAAGHVVLFFGRGLTTEKSISPDTIRALMALWHDLRSQHVDGSEQKHREIARQFAQWFASKHLPADWKLRELDSVLTEGAGTTDTEAVFIELSQLVNGYAQQVTRCLRLILLDQERNWDLMLWQRESTAVLEALLASRDEAARAQTLDLINQLVERGSLVARDIAQRANSPV